jgi:hypothetical protein
MIAESFRRPREICNLIAITRDGACGFRDAMCCVAVRMRRGFLEAYDASELLIGPDR